MTKQTTVTLSPRIALALGFVTLEMGEDVVLERIESLRRELPAAEMAAAQAREAELARLRIARREERDLRRGERKRLRLAVMHEIDGMLPTFHQRARRGEGGQSGVDALSKLKERLQSAEVASTEGTDDGDTDGARGVDTVTSDSA